MKKPEKDDWSRRRIQSIEVGFTVIRAMESSDGPMPLRDIAAAAGMPASKAHLYLVSFIREGLVRQDPVTGHYGLGSFAIQLGHSAIRQLDIVEMSRDELKTLQDQTGFASYLSLWGNRGPGIVSKVDGNRQGSLTVRLGYVLPVTTSATGQVFLAFHDPKETRPIAEEEIAAIRSGEAGWPMPKTFIDDPADLETKIDAIVAEVRNRGYSTTKNNINANFVAMAAPVFDHTGQIIASITLLGPEKGMSGPRAKAMSGHLLDATSRLSERLGYRASAAE